MAKIEPKLTGVLIHEQADLETWLSKSENEGAVVQTRLKASDRVIARVTDGIYRQPGSALRELVSNAWDADANNVTVLTDAPRFSRIYVKDDGAGMSYTALSRLVHQIGGSAKRREEGKEIGITAKDDADRTPGGRPIIGKIGIGLFSVSQLSRRFKIITKVRGEKYRLIAEIHLRAYSEDEELDHVREEDDNFITGDVYITREATTDIDAHGTDIILDDVKPRVRDILRSADRWRLLDEKERAIKSGDVDAINSIRVEAPRYHVGWIDKIQADFEKPSVLTKPANLPWSIEDGPGVRISKLMDAVEREFSHIERPDLASTLDTYLETLWTLGLSIPVDYVEKHPFDLDAKSGIRLFWLSNEPRGQASEVELRGSETVREAVHARAPGTPTLEDGTKYEAGEFKVFIDGIEIKRPIRFKFIPTGSRSLDKPMLFVGKYAPNLTSIDESQRGGSLSLESYLFWNGRIVPKENNGVLVRIRGASGATFDPTFFKYQVSEQTRLRQITSELFIRQGLDAALNIDRESFNFSHPHVQLVSIWVHRAIRQLTNKHKELSQRLRNERKAEEAQIERTAVAKHAQSIWNVQQGESEPIPEIRFTTAPDETSRARENGIIALERDAIPALAGPTASERADREAKTEALVQILAAFNVFEGRSYKEQEALIQAIIQIFYGSASNE